MSNSKQAQADVIIFTDFASPATISRAGMIYIDQNIYQSYWEAWLNSSRPKEEVEIWAGLFNRLVPEIVADIIQGTEGKVLVQTELHCITQFCIFVDAILKDKMDNDADVIECIFLECLYLSFGVALLSEGRFKFDEKIKLLNPLMLVQDTPDKPANSTQWPCSQSTLYDYFFDIDRKLWIAFAWMVPDFVHNPLIKFNTILVPTIDTLRTEWILQLMKQVRSTSH